MKWLSPITIATLITLLAPSVADAYDQRLDSARDFLVKAEALIKAAEDPGAKKPFGGHAAKAVNSIERALNEIELAKQAAGSS